ncbi:hypothetical protein ACIOHC_35950 [Streptomyces sp. NPDC088252]|uniref:hypothetical protein n=1 Tax=Streptomyces sp. NPDC088252 TaxID=3365845 RepID=UPI0037FD5DE8
MAANYPTIVRKFSNHQDGTEYVMAGHMNTVQDEISAVQNVLGTNPNVYTRTTGTTLKYTTVTARMNAAQQQIDAQQRTIDGLLDASKNGWSLPIVNVHASGTNIPPTKSNNHVAYPSDWYKVRWTGVIVDTDGAYSPGFYVTIPKNGWWIVTSTTSMKNPVQTVDVEHNVWVRLKIAGATPDSFPFEIAIGDSSVPMNSGGFHRISTACGVEMFAGDRVYMEVRHDYIAQDPVPFTKQTLAATARMQLTYVRALPRNVPPREDFYLPDELDPEN